jgi:hypothetical protein
LYVICCWVLFLGFVWFNLGGGEVRGGEEFLRRGGDVKYNLLG